MITSQTVMSVFHVTQAQADSVLAQLDQAQTLNDALYNLVYEVWDRTSAINGTPAAEMLARDDVNDAGTIYLLRDRTTQQVLFFQPHAPNEQGYVWMTLDTVATYGEAHRQELAQRIADAQTLNAISALLAPKP